jgi:hypothetical protein
MGSTRVDPAAVLDVLAEPRAAPGRQTPKKR